MTSESEAVANAERFLGANFPRLSQAMKTSFLQMAQAFRLNPFKREIYLTAYNARDGKADYAIIVGYEVYIKRAESSGQLNGWEVKSDIQDSLVLSAGGWQRREELMATCTVWRKDWARPFAKSVSFGEYAQKNARGEISRMWASKPRTMLEKVATAQAFRLAFPEQLGGIGYQAEELGGSELELQGPALRDITPQAEDTDEASLVAEVKRQILAFEDAERLRQWAADELPSTTDKLSSQSVSEIREAYKEHNAKLRAGKSEKKIELALAAFRAANNENTLQQAWRDTLSNLGIQAGVDAPPALIEAFEARLESLTQAGLAELEQGLETQADIY